MPTYCDVPKLFDHIVVLTVYKSLNTLITNEFFNLAKFGHFYLKWSGPVAYVVDFEMSTCYGKITDTLAEIYVTPRKVELATKNCVVIGDKKEHSHEFQAQLLCNALFSGYNTTTFKEGEIPVVQKYIQYDGYGIVTCYKDTITIDYENKTIYGDLSADNGELIKEPAVVVRKLDMKKVRDARKDYNLAMASFVGLYQMGAFKNDGWPTSDEWNKVVSKYTFEDVVDCKPWWWMKVIATHANSATRVIADNSAGVYRIMLTQNYWNGEEYKFSNTDPQRYVDAFWRRHKEDVYKKVRANIVKTITVREHLNCGNEGDSEESVA